MNTIQQMTARNIEKNKPNELVVACAITLGDYRIFVSARGYDECYMIAGRFAPEEDLRHAKEGYLTSFGNFVDKDRANKIAYHARQIGHYNLTLVPEDLFS